MPDKHTEHPSLAAALAAFQAEMPTVNKGQTARIPGKDGRTGYSYKYADLADVAQAAHPLLSKHGLSFTCRPALVAGTGFVLKGVLRHTSGERDVGMLPITGRDAQAIGSSLTYGRRYLLGCMTGIVTDEDEDGARAAAAGTERPQSDYVPPPPDTEVSTDAARPAEPANRPAERQPSNGATKPMLAKIGACLNDLGLKTRREQLAYVADVIGHPIETRNDLTRSEARSLIDTLEADLQQQREDNPQLDEGGEPS